MLFLIKPFFRLALAATFIASLPYAPAQAKRACFFVGLEPPLINTPVDATIVTLTHAFRNYERHVFVSYDAWNYFVDIYESVKKSCEISDPFDELAIIEYAPFKIPRMEALSKKGLTPSLSTLCTQLKPVVKHGFEQPLRSYALRLLDYEPHKWDMYDTQMGLYYFTPKNTPSKNNKKVVCSVDEICTREFLFVENQFQKKNPLSFEWINSFTTLFNDTGEPWYLTFLGHGIKRIGSDNLMVIAGIPTAQFAQLLALCNDQLPVAGVTISSCYASPEIIRSTAKQYATIDTFNFDLVTMAHRKELAVYAIGARPQRNIWPAWLNRPRERNTFFPSSALFITKNMDKSHIHAIDDVAVRKARMIDIVKTNYDAWTDIIDAYETQTVQPYHPCIIFKHEKEELVI